ncbi:MAG: cache domain-containing protein [Desulfovibrio sp.]|uniref:cache domain-containing protein n=1 Tax=Desulfovibrio sp. 7SRBS1 TaxID=3378064 RepID=UPI003B3EB71C
MDKTLVKRHERTLLSAMNSVDNCVNHLSRLDRQWTMATLTGKINCSRIAHTLIEFIITTQENFSSLKQNLIDTLLVENLQKVVLEISAVAQVAIDILKRNLFERTADVGFLATDDDIVQFLLHEETESDARAVMRIEERLLEYRNKYTVYNEIIILDAKGEVRAHLDRSNKIYHSDDPMLKAALEKDPHDPDQYVETYRETDLVPGRGPVLIYSQAIRMPGTGAPLGVLCLVFDFENEMKGIFENLALFSKDMSIAILDESGRAIASSDPSCVAVGRQLTTTGHDAFRIVNMDGVAYLAKTLNTKGYQGFMGLPWYGHVMKRLNVAFRSGSNGHALDEKMIRSKADFSGRLLKVEEASENVLSDLELVVQNGEIMAAKKAVQADESEKIEARALPNILSEVKKIGDQIQHVFQSSTGDLLKLVTTSRLSDVQFLAQLSIDIMDRNLYERANDCRWWALTSDFRRILAKGAVTPDDRDRMREILGYINGLYTVYTNLFVYDATGRILACSNPAEYGQEESILSGPCVSGALALTNSQQYSVSDFKSTHLYAGENGEPRHTYIYNAAITSLDDNETVVGGIGIIFDSEPQFRAMLEDVMPRDGQGNILENSEGLFVSPDGVIIASTNPEHKAGDKIPLTDAFCQLCTGEVSSHLVAENDGLYAVGCAHSAGYREYKRDGGYENDVLGIVRIRI